MGCEQVQGVNNGSDDDAETSADGQNDTDLGDLKTDSTAKPWTETATGALRAVLVHNPKAGDGEMSGEALRLLLRKANISAFYQSSKIGELTAALSMPCDLIIVAGGDGTVAKAITQLPNRSVPIAILPFGTANNIATSFGIGGRIADILGTLRDAERRRWMLVWPTAPGDASGWSKGSASAHWCAAPSVWASRTSSRTSA